MVFRTKIWVLGMLINTRLSLLWALPVDKTRKSTCIFASILNHQFT